jgi:hypothetical protein
LKLIIGLLATAGLLLAGCGGSAARSASTSSSPTSWPTGAAAGFSGPTKRFASAQLGIAFSYPADWQLEASDVSTSFSTYGMADAGVHSPKGAAQEGALTFQVESQQIYDQQPPRPYVSVGPNAARAAQRLENTKKHPSTRFGLADVGGLRLLGAQSDRTIPAPFVGTGRYGQVSLYSGSSSKPPYPTTVVIHVLAPRTQARAARATLDAILSTIRFSTPTGGWSGS